MRNITIDLSNDSHIGPYKVFGGYVGEHNGACLSVKLPEHMLPSSTPLTVSYEFIFQTPTEELVRSVRIMPRQIDDGVISVNIWSQLTAASGNLICCVAEIADSGTVTELVAKTHPICLIIKDSSQGDETLLDAEQNKEIITQMIDDYLRQYTQLLPIEPGTGTNSLVQKGWNAKAAGESAAAFGQYTRADGEAATAAGLGTQAIGEYTHAEGMSSLYFELLKAGVTPGAEMQATVSKLVQRIVSIFNHGSFTNDAGQQIAFSVTDLWRVWKRQDTDPATNPLLHELDAEFPEGDPVRLLLALGNWVHAEGCNNLNAAEAAHVEGILNIIAKGRYGAHAEGGYNLLNNAYGHAEGFENKLTDGRASHIEGQQNEAAGDYNHVAGYKNKHVSGSKSDVGGELNTNAGSRNFVRGKQNHVTGDDDIVMGTTNTVEADDAVVIGETNTVGHKDVRAFGDHLKSYADGQTLLGQWNDRVDGAQVIYGCGTGEDDNRANLFYGKDGKLYAGSPIQGERDRRYMTVGYNAAVNFTKPETLRMAFQPAAVAVTEANDIFKRMITVDGGETKGENNETRLLKLAVSAVRYVQLDEVISQQTAGAYYAFYDANEALLGAVETYTEQVSGGTLYLSVPAGAVYLKLNHKYAANFSITAYGNPAYVGEMMAAYIEQLPIEPGTGENSLVQKGWNAKAAGESAAAFGRGTEASGSASHAEGSTTVASDLAAHAEGMLTSATNKASHAEGRGTEASGAAAHAEGYATKAQGASTHAEGQYTLATDKVMHAEGKYNDVEGLDPEKTYLHACGNGTSETDRSNAYLLDDQGNAWFRGEVHTGTDNDRLISESEINQSYDAESENAQSGKAVAQAVAPMESKADMLELSSGSGKSVAVTDSAAGQLCGMNVYGESNQESKTSKNLIPYPFKETTKTENGITFTDNGDGTVTVNGSYNGDVTAKFCFTSSVHLTAGTYFLSGCPIGGGTPGWYMFASSNNGVDATLDSGEGNVLHLSEDSDVDVSFFADTGFTFTDVLIKPQLEIGTSATDFMKYGVTIPSPAYPSDIVSVENPVVTVCGKNLITDNLLALDNWVPESGTNIHYDLDIPESSDGDVFTFSFGIGSVPGSDYDVGFITFDYSDDNWATKTNVYMATGTELKKSSHTFTTVRGRKYRIWRQYGNMERFERATYFQLEAGAAATAYEPYKPPQTVTIPYTLRGIKDSDGSWAARDEIVVDGKKGSVTYIKNVDVREITDTITWNEWQSGNGSRIFFYPPKKTTGDTLGFFTIGETIQDIRPYNSDQLDASNRLCAILGLNSNICYWYPDYTAMGLDGTEEKAAANQKLQEWLAEIPLREFTYVLAEPQVTDITNTEAGQALLALHSYYPNTTILCDADSALRYKADTTIAYNNLLSRIAALEAAAVI